MNHLHQNPWSGMHLLKSTFWDFPGGPVVKTLSSNAGSAGSIPGRGAKIPHASRPKNQNLKQKQYCNKFNKDFKNGPHQEKKKKSTFFSSTPDLQNQNMSGAGPRNLHVQPSWVILMHDAVEGHWDNDKGNPHEPLCPGPNPLLDPTQPETSS